MPAPVLALGCVSCPTVTVTTGLPETVVIPVLAREPERALIAGQPTQQTNGEEERIRMGPSPRKRKVGPENKGPL